MVSPAQQSLIQSALAPGALANAVSTSVAAKALDAQRQQGASVVQLIDDSAGDSEQSEQTLQPGDALVAKATGLGSLLDITA